MDYQYEYDVLPLHTMILTFKQFKFKQLIAEKKNIIEAYCVDKHDSSEVNVLMSTCFIDVLRII